MASDSDSPRQPLLSAGACRVNQLESVAGTSTSDVDTGVAADRQGATAFATGLNMLNELEGAGLLGLPYALKLCGWVSLGALGVVGVIAGFTGYLLAMCMYDSVPRGSSRALAAGRRLRDSYAGVGAASFGETGRKFVRAVQVLNLVAVGIVYLVLIGSSMEILAPLGLGSTKTLGWLPMADRRVWTAVATATVLPTVHLGGYKKLAALSALGLLCLTAVIVLGIYTGAAVIAEHGARITEIPAPQLEHLPAATSIFVFAFAAHGIFPDLEASMAKPRLFPRVVSVVFLINIAVKVAFTLVCFLAYGQETNVVVAANYPAVPRTLVGILIVLNTVLSFPLPLVPVFRALGCAMGPGAGGPGRAVKRTLVVLFCGTGAVLVPNFALAMGFMGSITLSLIVFIMPATFYLRIHGAAATWPMRAACGFVVAFGVLGGVAGIVSNTALATGHHD